MYVLCKDRPNLLPVACSVYHSIRKGLGGGGIHRGGAVAAFEGPAARAQMAAAVAEFDTLNFTANQAATRIFGFHFSQPFSIFAYFLPNTQNMQFF